MSSSRKVRTAASSSRTVGRSCTSALREREELELHLRHPAAEARELDVLHAGEEGMRLHDADDAPLEVTEHLPPAHDRRIDPHTGGTPVGSEEPLPVAETTDRVLVGAEAPRAHAEPAEILHRVAHVHQLPVDHRPEAFGAEDHVAHAVVAVHERGRRGRRYAGREPAEAELEGGMRIGGDGAEDLLVALE